MDGWIRCVVEDGSDYHVKVEGTRLPILASSRLHVDTYREQSFQDYRAGSCHRLDLQAIVYNNLNLSLKEINAVYNYRITTDCYNRTNLFN
jgi:hypothetical protein